MLNITKVLIKSNFRAMRSNESLRGPLEFLGALLVGEEEERDSILNGDVVH